MRFQPGYCPRPECPSQRGGPFRYRRKGYFRRRCDGRRVQRFLCLECRRGFSAQSFRVDYRLKRPLLHLVLVADFVSKVTHRQSARIRGCSRETVAHRLRLLSEHCREFHADHLERARGRLRGIFQLDELETYEHSRRLSPVTLPLLVERKSFFVVHFEAAPLPARGRLSKALQEKKALRDALEGPRRSGSVAAVRSCFERLAELVPRGEAVYVQTDHKKTYGPGLRRVFGERVGHQKFSSKARRDHRNPLFPVNHTFAMMRDGLSRLVRRTWAGSKKRARFAAHEWIWLAWRNYVRGITNRCPRVTPAMALGVAARQWQMAEMLARRVCPTWARRRPGAA